MGLEKLICYCRSCKGEQAQPVQVTLDHAAKRDGGRYPYEFLKAMLGTVQDRDYISTTTVLSGKCLRSEVLKRTRPYTDDPKKLYAAFRGTMFHGQLEKHAHPGAIEEPRFHKYLEGLGWFSGSPDLVDPKGGWVDDYKSTREVPVFDYPWGDHKEQGQINRWLVDNCDYYEYRKEKYATTDVGAMHLHGACLDAEDYRENIARVRPYDWQGIRVIYMDNDKVKPILVSKSIDIPQKGDPKKTKKAKVADIWEDERVEALVRANYAKAVDALNPDNDKLPDIPEAYKSWKHPLCNYCAVKDACVEEYIESEVALRGRRS